MPLELGWDVLALLGLAAFASGFVDAISGGGGMITMPALLLAGLDPVSAVATNKLQGVFGTGSSMAAYARARMIDWKRLGWMMAGAAMAGMAGAFAVKSLPDHVLKALVPLLLQPASPGKNTLPTAVLQLPASASTTQLPLFSVCHATLPLETVRLCNGPKAL